MAKRWTMYAIIFTMLFSMFGGTAFGASTRFALVTEVAGTVKVTKAGGTKEMRAFTGMGLNEGDKVKVEKGSSLTLKVADTEDEVVLGENWNGTLSKLKANAGGGTETALKTWTGSMYNKVEKMAGSSTAYRVETPTAVMGVRGTHFILTIDPITGLPTLIVAAGRVAAAPTDGREPTLVLPAQQVVVYPEVDTDAGIGFIDPSAFVKNADDEVIAKMLLNKQQIDEENRELLGTLSQTGDLGESTLNLSEQETLDRYRQNVDNALYAVLRSSMESGVINEEEAARIVETANQLIQDSQRQYDLNNPAPVIDRTAGVSPAEEERRRQALQQAQQQAQQKQQQKQETQQQIQQQAPAVIQQVQAKQQQQVQQNQQAAETRTQEAINRYLQTLAPDQQQQVQQRVQQRQNEQIQQEQKRDTTTQQPTTGAGTGGGAAERLATTTTVTSTKSTIKRGEAVVLRASVAVTGGSPVTTGTVTFRRGTTTIGTAALNASGVAQLDVTNALSRQHLAIGSNAISAIYAGSDTLQSSTSFSIAVNVEKAATTVALNGPTESTIDNPLRFSAQVSVQSPGSGAPNGTVQLYEGTTLLQTKTVGSNGAVEFDEFKSTGPAGTKTYRAVYSGSDEYTGSEDSKSHTVKNADPGTPKVTIAKSASGAGTFTLQVKLDNFTAKRIYGMQLHFLSDQNVMYQAPGAGANGTYYEETIFQQPNYTAEMIKKQDGTVSGAPKRETIYALSLFGSASAVSADGDAAAVTIPFAYTGTGEISLVYAQFVDENGETIAVADYN
ncbi:Ig-like domain repeat protein [Paenibacillus sp.]|uniref:Ig-like domain repeat protein n=1 Tax=Paenibacillus sp. TaxID=58172 RepID=UPI002D4D166B|nr:Ig-like domain repeat protein [Paenibacillus sp.]HZG87248.1 Ig-like domain repeat protein [Paenibacillus sp.]